MGMADIDLRSALQAVEEYDRLGLDGFLRAVNARLKRFGKRGEYKESRAYWLYYRGRRHVSKALLGAAHGYARPDLGPLGPYDGGGGKHRVQRKFEALSPEFKFPTVSE